MIISTAINIGPWALPSQGSSSAAQYASEKAERGLDSLRSSVAYRMPFEDICQTYIDCSYVGWDGYQAEPVTAESRVFAKLILRSLPLGIAPPEISADPDGALTLEWYCSPRRTLSISVGSDGELHYAALIGRSRMFGSEPFFGDMPSSIISLINRVMASQGAVDNMPPVAPQEFLARFVIYTKHVRQDGTVKPETFMPHPYPDLSVTRHIDLSDDALWTIGEDVARQRKHALKGRADLSAKVYLKQKLYVEKAPIPDNPNHANVIGWPPVKAAQKAIAQELAASAVYTPKPE